MYKSKLYGNNKLVLNILHKCG